MGNIFSIASQKGGVGKTTTALNLGIAFAERDLRILIVDADPQGGIVYSLDTRKRAGEAFPGLYQVLSGDSELQELARATSIENLYVVDCGIVNIGNELHALEEGARASGLFREAIQNSSQYYDAILMDCPPGVGVVATGALIASDFVIVPLQSEPLSLRTLPQLLKQLIEIKHTTNHGIEIGGILITMHDEKNPISKMVTEQVMANFNEDLVFQTVIPRDPKLNLFYSGIAGCVDIVKELRSVSPGFQAYQNLATEVEMKFMHQLAR